MLHLVQVDVDDVLVAVQVTLQQLLVDQLEFSLATGLDVRGNGYLGNGSSVKKNQCSSFQALPPSFLVTKRFEPIPE